MSLNVAIELINEMIIKEHKMGNSRATKLYTKEELLIFCKKLLLQIEKS